VITYLSSNGYPYAVSPKLLASPTGKDFAQIVQFLFQKFDPNLKAFGKVEDEVPLFFKRMNYPFQISKSALFAVGSPHSWPSVLAALTWLVELLNYEEKAEGASYQCFDDKQRAERQFYQYVATSYKYFLAGEDHKCQAADDEMLGQFKEREASVVGALTKLKQVMASQNLSYTVKTKAMPR
jgi:kinetochore protein NDC80